jgi:anti-sigma factor RsiW
MKPETTGGISDDLLQRYFDGELSPEERARVEARLDDGARLRLDALADLRVALRHELTREPPGLDFSATFDAIERAAPSAAVPARRRRLLPMSAAGGLVAAAAALFLFLRPGPVPIHGAPPEVQSAASVETLESQGALASVFQVDNGRDHATVIWTDATPAPLGELQ